jgi:hypothetical protein
VGLHQLLAVLVDLAVVVVAVAQQAAQVAQESFTFSTRSKL